MLPEAGEDNSVISISFPERAPRIPKGTTISGVSVGGMKREDAIDALKASVPDSYTQENILINFGEYRLSLSPLITGVHWKYEEAVAAAMAGTNAEVELVMDKSATQKELKTFFDSHGGIYSPSGFWLEGEMPDLSLPESECQTLVLSVGASGVGIDLEEVCQKILSAYKQGISEITLDDPGEIKTPRKLKLDDVWKQVSISPVNPDLNRETLEVIDGKPGYGFDYEKAEALLENADDGELIRIPMKFIDPPLSVDDVWFQDALGYCKTEHSEEDNRNANLRLACSMLNEKILQPGETLSYNLTLGQRTSTAGYKPAPAYSGTELINEIGGGICQVSSTLYLSSLFAELTIVERKNHGFPANYIPMGLDATVNWGTTDLKIRNDYDLPIKILAEVDDLYVKVRIMGVEKRDYYVKMEYRVDDHPSHASAYRCRYDRATDEEIFRELDHNSYYLEDVWCWPGYAENAVDEP